MKKYLGGLCPPGPNVEPPLLALPKKCDWLRDDWRVKSKGRGLWNDVWRLSSKIIFNLNTLQYFQFQFSCAKGHLFSLTFSFKKITDVEWTHWSITDNCMAAQLSRQFSMRWNVEHVSTLMVGTGILLSTIIHSSILPGHLPGAAAAGSEFPVIRWGHEAWRTNP